MADFVNKVIKNGNEWEIRDARIEDVEALKTDVDGNSLVIPEPASQSGLEPVATIDNVDYYHKHEFDLENLTFSSSTRYDILTGDVIQSGIYPCIETSTIPMGEIVEIATFRLAENFRPDTIFSSRSSVIEYVSKAFTVVDTQSEVTDNTKICLPTCSAYYGFISEDGKTFISYFNLKGEGHSVPEYIDSIKQGNAVIPLHGKDVRLPEAEQADAGKVLKVADAGGWEIGEAGCADTEFALITTMTISVTSEMQKGDIYVSSSGGQDIGDPSKPYLVKPRTANVYGFFNQNIGGIYVWGFIALYRIDGSQDPVEIQLDVYQLA